jgi:PAS domain S-box-containing protein
MIMRAGAFRDAEVEVAALVRQMNDIQRRLQVLTGGEIDAIVDPDGQTHLLPAAQAGLADAASAQRRIAAAQSAVLDALPAHIAVLDPSGVIVSVNHSWIEFAKANGMKLEGLGVGVNYPQLCDAVVGDDAADARKAARCIRSVLDGSAESASFEYDWRVGSGRQWIRMSVTPFAGEAGAGAVVMHINISERRVAEEALRESELRFRSIVELSPNAIFTSVDDRVGFANPAALTLLRAPDASQVVGRSLLGLFLTADQARIRNYLAALAPESDSSGFNEAAMIALDGGLVDVELAAVKFEVEGREIVQLVCRDVSERNRAAAAVRRTNQLLQAVVDGTPDHVFVKDLHGRFLLCNEALARFHGRTIAQIVGFGSESVVAQGEEAGPLDSDRYVLESGQPLTNEVTLTGTIGRRTFLATRAPYRDENGKLLGLICIAHDITQRKRDRDALRSANQELEARVAARTAELEHARREAEEASRAKSTFLATMSHEIRTPMNGVLGMIELLQESGLKDRQTEMVDLIRESAFSLLGVIDGILDFSKIEAGKLTLANEPLDLAAVVENVCFMLDHVALKSGVHMTVFVDPAIPAQVMGDDTRLRQVLVNLAGNAIKFSGGRHVPGRVSVRAVLAERDRRSATIELLIADNGVGIDDATMARLFTPFEQADASTTRRYGGTGLGLAITHSLVRMMGGTISVKSRPGEGSLFAARLPFDIVEGAADAASADDSVAGLRCRIVGAQAPFCDDIAAYLVAARIQVQHSPDLAAAAAAAREPGLTIWLVLPDQTPVMLSELRAMAPGRADGEVRFVVLGNGRRRQPRIEAADLVTVDADSMFRRVLLGALAMVAGRLPGPAPRLAANEKAADEKAADADESPSRNFRGAEPMILVAEDNETNRKVIVYELEQLGFACEVAANGRLAFERWRSGNFALLLTDLHMPEMDGYALAAAVRAAEPPGRRTPIIALTANVQPEEEARCRAGGMDAYLTKPIGLPQLRAAIERWLGEDTAAGAGAATVRTEPADGVVDISTLAALVGDQASAINEILQSFRASATRSSADLARDWAQGDWRGVAAVAHKLKSSARAIGARRLGEICATLEDAAGSGKPSEVDGLKSAFYKELRAVLEFIDARTAVTAP